MKILISAIACNPYFGSEPYFGWSAVKCLAQDHDLWVLTSGRAKPSLEKAQAEGIVPENIRFIYAGEFKEWHPNRLLARLQGWKEYVDFSKTILPVARGLHQQEKFDLVHHVTYATWRVASPLWKLGIPFVFGPIGGNEQFPPRFFPILSFQAVGFELLRMLSNIFSKYSRAVRGCICNADHIFVANSETEELVKNLRQSNAGISWLTAAFYSNSSIKAFSRFAANKNLNGPLRLFAAGNMEGRKGLALAFEALKRAKAGGVRFSYRVGAGGPEIGHLKKLAAKLDLKNEIQFADNLRGEDYQRELGSMHVFLLPSLRESAGLTMMEAMLAGCVPVVADCGGPGIMVTNDCGYRIPVSTCQQMVEELAKAIIAIDQNRQIISEKGRVASQRIATHFSEENYRKTVNAIYESAVKMAKPTNLLYAAR